MFSNTFIFILLFSLTAHYTVTTIFSAIDQFKDFLSKELNDTLSVHYHQHQAPVVHPFSNAIPKPISSH